MKKRRLVYVYGDSTCAIYEGGLLLHADTYERIGDPDLLEHLGFVTEVFEADLDRFESFPKKLKNLILYDHGLTNKKG